MNSYRVTFLHNIECDYWGKNKRKLQSESFPNFSELHNKYYPIIQEIKKEAHSFGIKYIWHFYEPYIEITWLGEEKESLQLILNITTILKKHKISHEDFHVKYPENNNENFGDWFCCSEEEKEFGSKVHAKCSEIVELFKEYEIPIASGKGKKEQVKRTIHRLCNPLGLNYIDEAYICFSRGLICLLFRFFNFNKAVWIYRNIFRQKY
jgi:hypothetical protein